MTNKSLAMIAGFRSLADSLDERAEELIGVQITALDALLKQAWSIIERRTAERRTNV